MVQNILELKTLQTKPAFDQLPIDEKIRILKSLEQTSKDLVKLTKTANTRKKNAAG